MPTLLAVQGCCNSQPTSQARQAADIKQAQLARPKLRINITHSAGFPNEWYGAVRATQM